jgi:hypothetical protein
VIYFSLSNSSVTQNTLAFGVQYSTDLFFIGFLGFQLATTPVDTITGQSLNLTQSIANNYGFYNSVQTLNSGTIGVTNYTLKLPPKSYYSYNFQTS